MFVLIYEGAINLVIIHSMQLYYTLVFCTCNSFIVNMKNSNYTFFNKCNITTEGESVASNMFSP